MNSIYYHNTSKQRGFSLLELSIFIVLLGIGAVAFWQFSNLEHNSSDSKPQMDLLHRADKALTGYIFSRQRLPCPAQNPTSGVESCANNLSTGYLPYKTLGLPDKGAGLIRYGVLRRAAGQHDADLAQNKPRFQILHYNSDNDTSSLITPSPISNNQSHTHETGAYAKDFCTALSYASALPFNENFVHSNTGGQASAPQRNVAYALALPKNLRKTAGQGATLPSLTFGSPASNLLSTQRDVVLAVGPQALSARLSCASFIAAIRSYSNVQLSAAIHSRTLLDYLRQLDISVDKARASKIASEAALVKAYANILQAAADWSASLAKIVRAEGPWDALDAPMNIIFAKISLASAIVGSAAATTNVVLSTMQSLERATNNYDRVNDRLLPQANALKLEIDKRFFRAMDAGLYLPVSTPSQTQ